MTFGDIDAMNQRALESLDRLHQLGRYVEPDQTDETDSDPPAVGPDDAPVPSLLDPKLVSYRVSDSAALFNANQHQIQERLK